MRFFILATGLALVSGFAYAERLNSSIELGLWKGINTTIINGEDANKVLSDMREELISKQPLERQEMMREMFAEDDTGVTHSCVTEKEVARFTDRESFRSYMMDKEYGYNCRIIDEHFSLGVHRLEVSCEAGISVGIIGKGFFEKRIKNPKHVVITQKFDGENMIHEDENGNTKSLPFPNTSLITDEMFWVSPHCEDI